MNFVFPVNPKVYFHYLTQIGHVDEKKVQILISWLLMKHADLDLYFFTRLFGIFKKLCTQRTYHVQIFQNISFLTLFIKDKSRNDTNND